MIHKQNARRLFSMGILQFVKCHAIVTKINN